ncbi:MAG: hypothetical protein ABWY58_08290 [Aeromicrobium sp.]
MLWCGGLRLAIGPVVALPFGPVVAPVWLFAIVGAATLSLPIVSSRLVACERQAARSGWRLRLGRTAAFMVVYALALGLFAVSRLTIALVVVAVCGAAVCLVLAAAVGDAAVVVVLAAGLVVVFASTYPWFADPLLSAGPGSLVLAGTVLAAAATASVVMRD